MMTATGTDEDPEHFTFTNDATHDGTHVGVICGLIDIVKQIPPDFTWSYVTITARVKFPQ